MWKRIKAREYRCDLCGKKKIVTGTDVAFGGITFKLPSGWRGSSWKNRSCFCEDCSEKLGIAPELHRIATHSKIEKNNFNADQGMNEIYDITDDPLDKKFNYTVEEIEASQDDED